MADLAFVIGLPIGILVIAASVYFASLKTRYHYTSVLRCPKCQATFEHDWVPAMSFAAARLGRRRHIQCPLCHEGSTFDVWESRRHKAPA